jgi:15-cis-phytoene synthase
MQLYNDLCLEVNSMVTKRYSTSFTRGIKTLHKRFQQPVYGIYGFVRLVDEIVDTFHDFDKASLLEECKKATYDAIEKKISINPVLHAFQLVVHQYKINIELIDAFFYSMELDLEKKAYNESLYNKYIYGSAEVVGLMCLKVFCEGDDRLFSKLEEPAKKLGAAFQKVNFLRDIKSDYLERGRIYFPGVDLASFNLESKKKIESEIDSDFRAAYKGVMQLPKDVKPGVYTAFIYYRELLSKIQKAPASDVMQMRIRVPGVEKLILLLRTYSKFGFNIS